MCERDRERQIGIISSGTRAREKLELKYVQLQSGHARVKVSQQSQQASRARQDKTRQDKASTDDCAESKDAKKT